MSIDTHAGRVRNPDYSTSIEGAESVKYRAGSQKALLLDVYRNVQWGGISGPQVGFTDEEAAYWAGLLDSCYWKRCNELRQDGKIVVVRDASGEPLTRKGRAGVSRVVCIAT